MIFIFALGTKRLYHFIEYNYVKDISFADYSRVSVNPGMGIDLGSSMIDRTNTRIVFPRIDVYHSKPSWGKADLSVAIAHPVFRIVLSN